VDRLRKVGLLVFTYYFSLLDSEYVFPTVIKLAQIPTEICIDTRKRRDYPTRAKLLDSLDSQCTLTLTSYFERITRKACK